MFRMAKLKGTTKCLFNLRVIYLYSYHLFISYININGPVKQFFNNFITIPFTGQFGELEQNQVFGKRKTTIFRNTGTPSP